MSIPVYVGGKAVNIIDDSRLQDVLQAVNVEPVLSRAGKVVGVKVKPHSVGGETPRGHGSSTRVMTYPQYFEKLEGAQFSGIDMLGKPSGSGYKRWGAKEQFPKRRFNPDRIPAPLRAR